MATLFALALVTACGTVDPPPPPPAPSSPAAADIVARHNSTRSLSGVGALSVDGGMQANAQFHADRLVAGATACTGGTVWHSSELTSWYPGVYAGENVGCLTGCPEDGAQVMSNWMASSQHKANILRPEFTRIGVATACNGSVQMIVAHYRTG